MIETYDAVVDAGASDAKLSALALEHGTPLYVYDLLRLRARVAELRDALASAEARLFFATMANDCPQVLRLLAGAEVGACVNSIPHLRLAREAGFPTQRIQFTSTGIARADMRLLQAAGIRTNLDSLLQLEVWFGLGAREAGLRVNASSLGRGRNADRIGIDAAEVEKAVAAATHFGCSLTGLHIYLGTNFQHHDEMLPTLESFFDLAASVSGLRYLNIGGGIGINYRHEGPSFDVYAFGRGVEQYARSLRARLKRHVEIIVEPGRGLTAECGTFVTSVTDIKELGERRFAAVDGSIAVFPRPFHHPETPHRIRKLDAAREPVPNDEYTDTLIVGRTTFSRDILGSASLPKNIRIGDLIAFDDAGSYSQSMASRFLGQPEPQVAFLDD
ncbi:MAG: diaminopimelate decarboxylase family protein [Pyrinomonadaceae bacterium]